MLLTIYFVFYARHQVILPQASEEYGPICHYYVVVVPENVETNLMNPDEFLNQKVRIGKNNEHDESTVRLTVVELTDFCFVFKLVESSQQEVLPEGEPYIAAKFPHRTIPWTFYLGNGETYDGFVNRKLDQNVKYRIFVRAFVDTPQKVRVDISLRSFYTLFILIFFFSTCTRLVLSPSPCPWRCVKLVLKKFRRDPNYTIQTCPVTPVRVDRRMTMSASGAVPLHRGCCG